MASLLQTGVQAFEAHPHNGDWTDFCARWLSPREGMPLTLRRLQGKPTEGFIGCFTDEGIYVQVEPESLTMLPWRGPLRLTEGRAAEICRVNRLSQSATRLDTDDLDDFSVLRSQITLRGIVTSVPRTEEVGTLCQIVWESEPARPIGLHIKNLGTARLRPGMIVIASKQGGHWSLETRWRGVFARALWRLEETILPDSALTFLGPVSVEHKLRALAQIEPGQLGWMPGQLVGLNHLAKREGESFSGGESFGRPIKARQNKKFSRATLSLADGEIFGYSPNRFSEESADLYVNSVRVYLNFSEEQPGYCWLRRSFDLRLAPASLDNPNQHWSATPGEVLRPA